MKRRILSVLLTLCMVVTLLPTVAFAAEDNYGAFTVTGDDLSGVSYSDYVLTIGASGTYTVVQTEGTQAPTTDHIAISAESPSAPTASVRKICANGTALIVDGTDDMYTTVYIDADRDGVLDDGEQSLSAAGVVNAPADNSNLSAYTIYGGAGSGTITGDSMITVNGGKVDSIYGGNGSYSDMSGGVTIEMNGGNVGRILACGYGGGIGGTGKTASVTIHGGTVRGGVDQSVNLQSRNNASNTSLLIDGGTIYGQISVKSTASFVIKGGNILASIWSGSSFNSSPTDGTSPVYKTTLTLKNGITPVPNTDVSALSTDAGYTYGMADVKTDTDGKLYVYLPAGKTISAITVGNNIYVCSVTTNAEGTAAGEISGVISTSPEATDVTVVKTEETQASVAFTLTTAPVGTYKVYADNTTATVHSTVTASLSGMALTLTDSTADIAPGDYYISVTEAGKLESTRLKLTVKNKPPCVHEGGTATCHTLALCTICGKEYGVLDADNHDAGTEIRNALSADCEHGGYTGDTYCLGCNALIQTGTDILPLNHDFSEKVIDAEHKKSSATCTDGAVYYYDCNRCDEMSTTATFEYGEPLGHSFTNYIYNNDANYYEDGTETAECNREGCTQTDTRTAIGTKLIDLTAPTGEIQIGTNSFKNFFNSISFGLFFKENVTVTIIGSDSGIGLDKIYYFESETALTLDEVKALSAEKWTQGNSLSFSSEWQGFVYAKITDKAGNVLYISSDELVLDKTAPVISGVSDGGKYCNTATVSVDETNLDTVKLDGITVTLENGRFTVSSKAGTQKIVVTDKSGNEATATITVYADHIWDEGEVTKEPTSFENGVKTYTCTVCGETKTEEISIINEQQEDTMALDIFLKLIYRFLELVLRFAATVNG